MTEEQAQALKRQNSDDDPPILNDEGEIDFQADKPGHMTWSRRLALYLASRYSWYNPHLGKPEDATDEFGRQLPSIARAWAYFEHVTLERYVVAAGYRAASEQQLNQKERVLRAFHRGERRLEKAEPGENTHKTKLYNPLTTPLSQLGDFGLGYGLYFSTLRAFSLLCFITGLLNIPNLLYFASEDYSLDQGNLTSSLLKGSAICTGTLILWRIVLATKHI